MPLRSLNFSALIYAFNYPDAHQWNELRSQNRSHRILTMPCCSGPVVLKTSKLGTRYFAHATRDKCTSSPETAEHLLAKATIAEGVRVARWQARIEVAGTTPSGEPWIADVLAERENDRPVAFEVQWGQQTDEETRKRQARYAESSIRALWFLKQPWLLVEKETPTFRLVLDETANGFHVQLLRCPITRTS